MFTGHLYYAPLLALLIWAAATDVRARRIPNWLSVSLALSGLVLSFTRLGALSPKQSALGLAAGLGIGFVLFTVGAWGAGDAKLVAGIGAWLGAVAVMWVMVGAVVIGMVVALIYSAAGGRLRWLLRDGALLGLELTSGSRPTKALTPSGSVRQLKARTVPVAVPLLVATAALLALNLLRGR